MRLINHALTTVAAMAALSFHIPITVGDLPLAVAGTLMPNLLEHFKRKNQRETRSAFHSPVLWGTALVLSLLFTNNIGAVHLWAFPLGGLLHVGFDAFSDTGVPILPAGFKKKIALGIYKTENIISEDSFAWLITFLCIGLWLWRHRG